MDQLVKLVIAALVQISTNSGTDFDSEKAKEYMKMHLPARAKEFVTEAKKDYEEAKSAFLGGEHMARVCMSVSIQHNCTMFAKETFEYSKK
jgi:hypothetical protein